MAVEKKIIMPKFLGSLLFGDKDRIKLDSIGLRFKIDDGLIHLEPLDFTIDKYKIGASGLMEGTDFFYHVALLKSPIGMKIGFDIYGSPGHLHYRLSRVQPSSMQKMHTKLNTMKHQGFIPSTLTLPNDSNANENEIFK